MTDVIAFQSFDVSQEPDHPDFKKHSILFIARMLSEYSSVN